MELTTNLVAEAARDLIRKKEQIVCCIIKDFLGIDIDLEQERQCRFRQLAVCCDNGEETWYYNDGSPSGKAIATFRNGNANISESSSTGLLFTQICYNHLIDQQ